MSLCMHSILLATAQPADTGTTSIKQQEQGKHTRAAPGTATSHLLTPTDIAIM